MYLKRRKASTDPRLRSLLQKAVRRGFVPIVERVVMRLDSIGDSTWLRSRTVVITFEECWPAANLLALDRQLSTKISILSSVARALKQKDAAGLGALAHAYREGDKTVLDFAPDRRTLQIVAGALERPSEFFTWLTGNRLSRDALDVIGAAQRYFPVATWDWDKACILAGALLATRETRPATAAVNPAQTPNADHFPYWVALDKHTDEGKAVFRDVAKAMKVKYRQLIWASFYCESATVNELLPSPWFDAERVWRLSRAKMTDATARELWSSARTVVRERLAVEAESLKRLIETRTPALTGISQTSLL